MKKIRIDDWLVLESYFDTTEEAARYIMAGQVIVNDERVHSRAEKFDPERINARIKGKDKKYVSRGGLKLEKAIQSFNLNLVGETIVDIGSSTGGFTDCALKHGAIKSYAIDVGTNQLEYQLRIDSRVVVMEQTNFRFVTPNSFDTPPTFATIDVSFISLQLIFPTLKQILASNGQVIALIKPQFEAAREEVGNKGIVTNKNVHKAVIQRVIQFAEAEQLGAVNLIISPIKGAAGNIEYLLHLKNNVATTITFNIIESVVNDGMNKG